MKNVCKIFKGTIDSSRLDRFGDKNVRRLNEMYGLDLGPSLANQPFLNFEWSVLAALFNKFGCKFSRTAPDDFQVSLLFHEAKIQQ